MVGIVVVSHSRSIASGVVDLARQVGGPEVSIAAAGGLAADPSVLGTDADLIRQAIESVYSPSGVAIFTDLGSAILSADLAIELLPAVWQPNVRLADAPLVEGAIAAAARAAAGGALADVLAEARLAGEAKREHLGQTDRPAPSLVQVGSPNDTSAIELVLHNPHGLHARPAGRLVQVAARFTAAILIWNLTTGAGPADARSFSAVATLGAQEGHRLRILATGAEARAALAAIETLTAASFGDLTDSAALPRPETPDANASTGGPPVPPDQSGPAEVGGDEAAEQLVATGGFSDSRSADSRWTGLPASPGEARGPAWQFRPAAAPAIDRTLTPSEAEAWLAAAGAGARRELDAAQSRFLSRGQANAAEIIGAQLLLLDDPAIRSAIHQRVQTDQPAAEAVRQVFGDVAQRLAALADPYQRERAADARQVGDLLVAHLDQSIGANLLLQPSVVLADELNPAQLAALGLESILAVGTVRGSPAGHLAIVARSLGIPAVVGLAPSALAIPDGTPVVVDGAAGLIRVASAAHPTEPPNVIQRSHPVRSSDPTLAGPAITRDGRRIPVRANVGSLAEARLARELGAAGIGLLRTELAFLGWTRAPSESEQLALFRAIAEAIPDQPITIRTWDVGADKPLPFFKVAAEANPSLGQRGLRTGLAEPELQLPQLRAMGQLAASRSVRIMFPMVSTVGEWAEAVALVMRATADLNSEVGGRDFRLEVGIMVEVPAVALAAATFASKVDFFSIGTNDLTQYTLAADRANPRVAALADPLDPAVLQLIHVTASAAAKYGKSVGVCGELAADPAAVPLLVGLGVTELSVAPDAVPVVKRAVRNTRTSSARPLARAALKQDSAAAVRSLLKETAERSLP
jgi:phosphocarrier protein FPr